MRTFRLLLVISFILPAASWAQAPRPDADPRIEKIVASISEERLKSLLEKLVSFGTRNTLSDQTSPTQGIGAARNWILEEMRRSSENLRVTFDTHQIAAQGRITSAVDLRNVMAVLPGRSPRRIYVSGHYDTVNIGGQNVSNSSAPGAAAAGGGDRQTRPGFNPNVEANGANDDGSGTVLTMELARAFAESGIQFDATLVFIAWAGEEQGLVGSNVHAEDLKKANVPVEAMFNNDIVGNSLGGNGIRDGETVKVYAIGPEDSPARALARHIRKTAGVYVPSHRIRLMAREDRFGRGSDQSSFTQNGFPAIVFREANENFERQHGANDKIDGVDFGYLAQNARVNAAGVAALALAPPAPKVTSERGGNLLSRDPSGYDATMRWNASPGAVAYRIYWRDTWTNDWEHSQTIGNVTQFTLKNVNIDDFVFGVSAISAEGQESLVSSYVSPVRAGTTIKRAQ
ncbi:MAG TPA: M20/M25/M40 family metallo-hydrolase [Vicinamibacterales bacterium]|nr:M20/M25/M40 family metallo-hydrolase [Vicinamibacterales bacterium]